MEKWMIVYLLPLEVWMDIFCFPWITRGEFGEIVDRIGNYKFAEHAQFYLHEWGKRTLGELKFNKDGIYKNNENFYCLDVPQTELPANMRSFENIVIRHFDAKTIDFLRKIEPLLADIGIHVDLTATSPNSLANLRTILSHLVPLLGEIHSMWCDDSTFPLVRQSFPEQLAQLKVLHYFHFDPIYCEHDGEATMVQENVNSIMDWLTQSEKKNTGNNDGLKLCDARAWIDHGFSAQISAAIRQQFLVAKTACTFALIVRAYRSSFRQVAEFQLENGIGEQLHGSFIGNETFQITRHRADCNKERLQEWIGANRRRTNLGQIDICSYATGSLVSPMGLNGKLIGDGKRNLCLVSAGPMSASKTANVNCCGEGFAQSASEWGLAVRRQNRKGPNAAFWWCVGWEEELGWPRSKTWSKKHKMFGFSF